MTMFFPRLEDFKEKAREGNLIPVYKEILADMETPVSAFLKIDNGQYSYLLESVVGGEKWARYSFLGSNPSVVIKGKGDNIEITRDGKKETVSFNKDPLDVIKKEMERYRPVNISGLPRFFGGAVGYLGYDVVRFFEKVPDYCREDLELPDFLFMITDTLLIFDSLAQKIKVISNAHIDDCDPEKAYKEAKEKIQNIIERLRKDRGKGIKESRSTIQDARYTMQDANIRHHESGIMNTEQHTLEPQVSEEISSNLKKKDFENMVKRAKEYIASGDIIQVVLSQRFEKEITFSSFEIYRALRVINPSPYMYFLRFGNTSMIGSSPEILVRLEGKVLEERPIAGTRKRGSTEEEDKALEKELLNDPKEMAEHIMLVDLGRNDLGRVSEIGSVRMKELMVVERYSHVMHIVSDVEGILAEGKDSYDVLRACFPAGTVSGAPKIRAMEIIEELEPTRRGPYAGAVGYFSFSGNM
ncbi:MAG: chorismate-binding protein, partial [Nitrospirae bacterium]|nr:chorismate-binding protein [Nitrospirota bacterium]